MTKTSLVLLIGVVAGGIAATFGSGRAVAQTPAEAAAAVRSGPFSQLFNVGSVYVVKDKDFDPAEPKIRFGSVWIDHPNQGALEVAVRYCVPEADIAQEGASLAEMTLLDNQNPLVKITKVVSTSSASETQVRAPQYTPPVVIAPYITPYTGLWGGGYVADPGSYTPAIDCSAGATRFDLAPVISKIASLPNRTLQVQLLFSNGSVQNWQLGSKTVQALKSLPEIKRLNSKI
ncbi:MAG: hypothetical protein H7Y22_14350 [Gemmatimonadaceae bacterium]|nr:hypothetical protein [Gloeobacterales cyanobacterium ES-bin-141]